jgi:hypothetical protein
LSFESIEQRTFVFFVLDKAGIQSEYTNIRSSSNNAEDLWFEAHAKPIKTFLIVHLSPGVDFELAFKVSNSWENDVKKL